MGRRRKIAVVFGTRPEAIKMLPVVLEFRKDPDVELSVVSTGQHKEMLQQVLDLFQVVPDFDLKLMTANQTLPQLTGLILQKTSELFAEIKPDFILVQGDTTTVLATALAAFYAKIPVGHVEAGLRTGNLYSPFPEEANRRLTTPLAALHFAPTELSRDNLLRENIDPAAICVTGNTVIDALFHTVQEIDKRQIRIPALPDNLQPGCPDGPRLCLITGHRRESFGKGFENICGSIVRLAERFPDCAFVYPVHMNPNVRSTVTELVGKRHLPNVHLIDPLDYPAFVGMMKRAYLILSDSGGVQEEAPSLGKPVLVMRDNTERPEGIAAGTCRLVGTDPGKIESEVALLLADRDEYRRRCCLKNPYGDGKASRRICERVMAYLSDL